MIYHHVYRLRWLDEANPYIHTPLSYSDLLPFLSPIGLNNKQTGKQQQQSQGQCSARVDLGDQRKVKGWPWLYHEYFPAVQKKEQWSTRLGFRHVISQTDSHFPLYPWIYLQQQGMGTCWLNVLWFFEKRGDLDWRAIRWIWGQITLALQES